MNEIKGNISEIKSSGNLSIVKVSAGNLQLSAIVIDTPQSAPYLETGREVKALFKETEVVISTGTNEQISLRNRIDGIISEIDSGELLSRLTLNTDLGNIISVITTESVKKLRLEVGTEATALIKTNEIMISA